MYKLLAIGGKDYKLEYSIEAALYADCAEAATGLFVGISTAAKQQNAKELLANVSNLASASLTMLYAGLMEHHGLEEGDGTVPDKATAKKLLSTYIKEHKDDETGDFYGFIIMLIEKMGEDNFFKLIGLEGIMEGSDDQKALPVTPQDHKPPRKKKVSEK